MHGAVIFNFLAVGLASSAHHLCDTRSIDICWRPAQELYFGDVFFSYLAILTTPVPFYTSNFGQVAIGFNTFAAYGVWLLFGDKSEGALIIVCISLLGFLLSQFNDVRKDKSRLLTIVPAAALVAFGIYAKMRSDEYSPNDGTTNYRLWHSIWHSFTAASAAVLYIQLPVLSEFKYCQLEVLPRQTKFSKPYARV